MGSIFSKESGALKAKKKRNTQNRVYDPRRKSEKSKKKWADARKKAGREPLSEVLKRSAAKHERAKRKKNKGKKGESGGFWRPFT